MSKAIYLRPGENVLDESRRQRRVLRVYPDSTPSSSAVIAVGVAAPDIDVVGLTVNDETGSYVLYADPAAATPAGLDYTAGFIRRAWEPDLLMPVKTYNNITTIRLWFGWTTADIHDQSLPGSDGTHAAAFRYDTTVDVDSRGNADPFWRTVTSNGDDNTDEVRRTNIPVTTFTRHTFRIEMNADRVRFFDNDGSPVSQHSTVQPGFGAVPYWPVIQVTSLAGNRRMYTGGFVITHII